VREKAGGQCYAGPSCHHGSLVLGVSDAVMEAYLTRRNVYLQPLKAFQAGPLRREGACDVITAHLPACTAEPLAQLSCSTGVAPTVHHTTPYYAPSVHLYIQTCPLNTT
jgi:hypothetical protein